MSDLRQSPEFARYMEKIGWEVGKEKNFQFYLKNLPLLGPFIKIQRPPRPILSKQIDALAKKYHAFAVQVNYSPTKTLRVDLAKPFEQILSQMQKDTRYEIRKAQKNQVVVEPSSDIEVFIKMWHRNALRRGFWIPFGKEIRSLYESFGKNACLLLTYHDSNPIASALILFSDKTAYYFYAASTPLGRRKSAPTLIAWEAIKQAKKKNCRIFDFEGILDPRDKSTKSWAGFTHFKKSFGGKEIEYPGTFTKFYNPVLLFIDKLNSFRQKINKIFPKNNGDILI